MGRESCFMNGIYVIAVIVNSRLPPISFILSLQQKKYRVENWTILNRRKNVYRYFYASNWHFKTYKWVKIKESLLVKIYSYEMLRRHSNLKTWDFLYIIIFTLLLIHEDDFGVLTPAHFLINRTLNCIIESDLTNIKKINWKSGKK